MSGEAHVEHFLLVGVVQLKIDRSHAFATGIRFTCGSEFIRDTVLQARLCIACIGPARMNSLPQRACNASGDVHADHSHRGLAVCQVTYMWNTPTEDLWCVR